MQCTTIRAGRECFLMGKNGCKIGECRPIVDECNGCERILEINGVKYCSVYPIPEVKWKNGLCNFATHKKPVYVEESKRINPLKASKRAARRR